MEELAKELLLKINDICICYHYFKKADTVEKGIGLSEKIQQFVSVLLEGNIFGMEKEEQEGFQNYVLQTLEDYAEAAVQRDAVLMVDTLDYGFRELLDIFVNEEEREGLDGQRDF